MPDSGDGGDRVGTRSRRPTGRDRQPKGRRCRLPSGVADEVARRANSSAEGQQHDQRGQQREPDERLGVAAQAANEPSRMSPRPRGRSGMMPGLWAVRAAPQLPAAALPALGPGAHWWARGCRARWAVACGPPGAVPGVDGSGRGGAAGRGPAPARRRGLSGLRAVAARRGSAGHGPPRPLQVQPPPWWTEPTNSRASRAAGSPLTGRAGAVGPRAPTAAAPGPWPWQAGRPGLPGARRREARRASAPGRAGPASTAACGARRRSRTSRRAKVTTGRWWTQ